MSVSNGAALQQFKNLVGIKFQLYNSLFTSLPFHKIENTGFLIPILLLDCEEGYKNHQSPEAIIETFFSKQTNLHSNEEQLDLLFRLTQYIERQVVLFDALEDAAFAELHDLQGAGTLKHLSIEIDAKEKEKELAKKLEDFSAQLVLTAHPTQFYRGAVLGIIHDLAHAIKANNENQVYSYLQQLGRTPFYQQQKPTPYEEAITLVWYLENVFYHAIAKTAGFFKMHYPQALQENIQIVKMGFWPGGDRDGNPFVTAATTLKVAQALRQSILKCYYLDIRKLKRRLTFKDVDVLLASLEKKLYNQVFLADHSECISRKEIIDILKEIRKKILDEHNGLFVGIVENFITKVQVFGLHFASLDIRQDSAVHTKLFESIAQKTKLLPENYMQLSETEKIETLFQLKPLDDDSVLTDETVKDTLASAKAIKQIQQANGEQGCHRYIISQTNSALNIIEVMGILLLAGWKMDELTVDIVPLFETIDDLQHAGHIMQLLYSNAAYRAHLHRRNNKQTIMLGFSDGTKDGGYLMANWSIYKAKEMLTQISNQYDIDVVFFDGRGGPPARGGGKTHNFYASLGKTISGKEIQLTVQGQTVSSNFGTVEAAQYNLEQLLHAGISNELFANDETAMPKVDDELLSELAMEGYQAYKQLKDHPHFADYLLHASPLRFYADTNIGSRPAKRGSDAKLSFKDLRAIPFVGAWSQVKQNVTGYYGVGTALEKIFNEGRWHLVQTLYHRSLFFRTLIDNCEMAMKKSFFPLTAYLKDHAVYGEIWNMLYSEYELSKQYIFKLTGQNSLMASYPADQLSIQMRERIVLPLLTIQQYALTRLRAIEMDADKNESKAAYEKLVMRCSFGIINSGRNSA